MNTHPNLRCTCILLMLATCSLFLGAQRREHAGQRASLFRPSGASDRLFSDPKARGINDIVIIQISENSTASNKAGLSTSKKSSADMGISALFGLENKLKTDNFDPSAMIGHNTTKSDQGEGESTRESKISAYIAARVVEVLPNESLLIEAKKEVMINKEKQVVVLRGMIRPVDITWDNTISSNKIADMQILFSGRGPVSEQTRRGWLSWVLNVIWPF